MDMGAATDSRPISGLYVHCVPRHGVARIVRNPICADLLVRGMVVAGVEDAHPTIIELMGGAAQLWLVYDADESKPIALFKTRVCEDDSGKWVGVSNLAGSHAKRWAGLVDETMAALCREIGASYYLFVGRRGWERLLPACKAVDSVGAREMLYRRAVA